MLGAVDCTIDNNRPVCSKYGVKGFPTMVYLSYGESAHRYSGAREQDAFVEVRYVTKLYNWFVCVLFLCHVSLGQSPFLYRGSSPRKVYYLILTTYIHFDGQYLLMYDVFRLWVQQIRVVRWAHFRTQRKGKLRGSLLIFSYYIFTVYTIHTFPYIADIDDN